jgi:hypothetical protein
MMRERVVRRRSAAVRYARALPRCRVTHGAANTQVQDVIMEVDGTPIAADETVTFRCVFGRGWGDVRCALCATHLASCSAACDA